VGHDENPPPEMRRTQGGRRYTTPLRIEPERGQITKDFFDRRWVPLASAVSPRAKEPWDIFNEREPGSKFPKASIEFGPEPSGIFSNHASAGATDGLAGESTTNKVWSLNDSPVDSGDISEIGDSGEVFGKDSGGILVDFRVPDGSETCPLEAEFEAPDAREESPDGWLILASHA
jgi:hypothetical protein